MLVSAGWVVSSPTPSCDIMILMRKLLPIPESQAAYNEEINRVCTIVGKAENDRVFFSVGGQTYDFSQFEVHSI